MVTLALAMATTSVDLLEAQTSWFKSHGGQCSAVRIGASKYGRGLFAARRIVPGERILEIPNSLMLTADKLPEEARSAIETEYDWCALTLLLLAEKQKEEESVWAPYISALPRAQELHSTIFWSDKELEYLECSRVVRGTMERRAMVVEEFAQVAKVIEAFPGIFQKKVSFMDFAYAYATVVSRAWNLGSPNAIALRPFVDFCNHDPTVQTVVSTDKEQDATIIVSDRHYEVGDEIFICYGKRPNAILAVDYGFTVGDNPYDQAQLWMEIPSTDPLREPKLDLMTAYNMPTLCCEDGSESGELPVLLEEVQALADWEDEVILPQARAFSRIITSDSLADLDEMFQEARSSSTPLAYLPRRDEGKEAKAMDFLSNMIEVEVKQHEKALLDLQSSLVQPVRRKMVQDVVAGELRVLKNIRGWMNFLKP